MKIIFSLILFLASIIAFSQGNNSTQPGSKAQDFELATLTGNKIQLSKLYNNHPVVLIVLRGWPGYQCPICTRQVGSLLADENKFKKSNAVILLVYPGPSEDLQAHAKEFSEDFSFPENFYFIIDPEYSMINKYDLRWDEPRETAYPSTFVINKEGEIVFARISTTHGGRASNDDILKSLEDL